MSHPLITVIIPVYNILDCLERCVASVCMQTWENLEILLVDDGSTDGTGQLCDRLAKRDGRIRVFHKPNGGSSSARNLGIEKANGEWLGFVDSDDFIEPQMYETMMREALEGGYRIVQVSRDEIGEDGARRPDVCAPPKEAVFRNSGEFLRTLLLHEGDCSFCTKLVNASLFQERRFPEGASAAPCRNGRNTNSAPAAVSRLLPHGEQYPQKRPERVFQGIYGYCEKRGLRAEAD